MLDRDTIRKIQKLIVFTLLILVGLWRFDVVVGAARFILHILSPFLLGGAIAFILNVPMCRIQKRLRPLDICTQKNAGVYNTSVNMGLRSKMDNCIKIIFFKQTAQ